MAKEQKAGRSTKKKTSSRGLSGAAKEIDKLKKPKKSVKAGLAESIKELEKSGMEVADLMASLERECESPAKRSRQTIPHEANLTGAHDEPRQEQ